MKNDCHGLTSLHAPRLARFAPAFILSYLFIATPAHASERWATLEAIHLLENPSDSPEPGVLGELGAYQFREDTWKMYTRAPFREALNRRTSDAIAVKHYNWIKSELEHRGVEVSPYMIALAWNGGIGAAVDPNPPAAATDYAARAANLEAQFERNAMAAER